MNELGLSSVHNKHKTRSLTNSKKARTGDYPNLTKGIAFETPLQAVCSDITYIKDGEGWLYLCAVKDICSGELLVSSTGVTMKSELVIKAFMNVSARHSFSKGIIFHLRCFSSHSDRGSQYTSKEFMNMLKNFGIRQSFSRVGMPGDNSWAEIFFATLKKEVRSLSLLHTMIQGWHCLVGLSVFTILIGYKNDCPYHRETFVHH